MKNYQKIKYFIYSVLLITLLIFLFFIVLDTNLLIYILEGFDEKYLLEGYNIKEVYTKYIILNKVMIISFLLNTLVLFVMVVYTEVEFRKYKIRTGSRKDKNRIRINIIAKILIYLLFLFFIGTIITSIAFRDYYFPL